MQGQVAHFFPQRKDPQGSWGLGLVELEGSLAETSKSRRLGQRLKATTGKPLKAFLQRSEETSKLCFFEGLKVRMKGIRLGLLASLVCKVSFRGMSAVRCICLVRKLHEF